MTDQEVNLHELVKLPFGEANAELKKMGYWNEDGGKSLKQYKVQYQVTYRTTEIEEIPIKAEDEDDAIERAYDKIYEDDDVDDITILKVRTVL